MPQAHSSRYTMYMLSKVKRRHNFLLLLALAWFLAECNNSPLLCLPINKANDLQPDTIIVPNWNLKIGDDIEVRVVVAKDQSEDLAVRAIFTDSTKKQVAVLPLENLSSSPVYIAWIDDEITKTLSDGQQYTTIHAVGYVLPDIYKGRSMASIEFLFQSQENSSELGNDSFDRISLLQDSVFWFPATNADFENHKYLAVLGIDTKESLATSAAIQGPGTYREWERKYSPAISIYDHLTKLSQLDWLSINQDTKCVTLK